MGHNKRACKEPVRSLNINKLEMKRRSSNVSSYVFSYFNLIIIKFFCL